MTIFAKPGMFVARADFADPVPFAAKLAASGFGWCVFDVAVGTTEKDSFRIPEMMAACRAVGVRPGIWHYLTTDPAGDARLASALITKYDDASKSLFYIADAEAEYKDDTGGDKRRSRQFVQAFRALRPFRTAALSSYGAAVWDNSLGSVFDYVPWQTGLSNDPDARFEFLPQAYFQDASEYEPRHCVDQAIANGWPVAAIHPTVGLYQGVRGYRLTGADWAYLLRRLPTGGYSVFTAEHMTADDYTAFKTLGG